jgi:hypothetical protein
MIIREIITMGECLHIFPIHSKPFGLSFSDWTIKWWQWITSIPQSENPTNDETGKFVTLCQENNNDVIFLCQTIEGLGGVPTRRSTISNKRFFFMPIINWISISGVDGNDDEEMLKIAKTKMDVIDRLDLVINGRNIENLKFNRVRSNFFDIDLPANNILDLPEGKRRCLSDGYWVFFHICSNYMELSTNSSCSLGVTQIGTNYELTIR